MDAENLDFSLLEEIETQAVYFAREAGQILLEQFRKPLEVRFKREKQNDPVTIADHLSEEYLQRAIREKFPRHGILSEEGGALYQPDSPFIWVLDPLDGTSNFINGLPLFAVSIGVLWKNQPVVGSIYAPVSHCTTEGVYHASLGRGAFFEGERIAVTAEPSGRPLAEIPPHFRNLFRFTGKRRIRPHEARNLGSIALELAMTACGVFHYSLFGSPRLWDIAAGVLLVKEAGGLVFTCRPGGRKWLPLERFQTEKESMEVLENLRKWLSPLAAGAPDTVTKVVEDIRTRHHLLPWLRALKRLPGRRDREKLKGEQEAPP
ncbi:MAG: inositol monophosphatase [Dehalococcoidales bacterium]|nr:inositol monophosphatase [Dehalococcoidales bacterium]